jgi:hypothetical protein
VVLDPARLSNAALLKLREALAADGSTPVVVLIDPALTDPFSQLDLAPGIRKQSLRIEYKDLDRAHQPYLLWFDSESSAEAVFNRSVGVAVFEATDAVTHESSARSICAWITPDPDQTPLSLARALAARSTLVEPGGTRKLFRFFDPRVLDQMPRIMGSTSFWHWLGPVRAWHFVGREGELVTLSRLSHVDTEPMIDAMVWRKLERIVAINKLLQQSRDWGVYSRSELPMQLDRYMEHAFQAGLLTEQDQMVFATCCSCISEQFFEHPVVEEILARARRGESRFADAMANLDDAQLDAIATFRATKPTSNKSTSKTQ